MQIVIHRTRGRDSFQNAYVHRLEVALATPHFDQVLSELGTDSRISHEELAQIANEFYAPIAKSSSKTKILQYIRQRHRKLVEFAEESKRVGNRSAS